MDILDDMSKLSAKVFFKVNYSFKSPPTLLFTNVLMNIHSLFVFLAFYLNSYKLKICEVA